MSHFPGTTLDIVSFALNSGQTLYDTPGVQNSNHMVPLLTPAELDFVLPRKCLKPVTYRLMAGKTIFLGTGSHWFRNVMLLPFLPMPLTSP